MELGGFAVRLGDLPHRVSEWRNVITKKLGAEFLGTGWLVFGGCGYAEHSLGRRRYRLTGRLDRRCWRAEEEALGIY